MSLTRLTEEPALRMMELLMELYEALVYKGVTVEVDALVG
jgi:hypothetical protein